MTRPAGGAGKQAAIKEKPKAYAAALELASKVRGRTIDLRNATRDIVTSYIGGNEWEPEELKRDEPTGALPQIESELNCISEYLEQILTILQML